MARQIDLANVHPKFRRHLLGRPLFPNVAVENLELLRVHFLPHPLHGRGQQVLLPFLVPERVEISCFHVRNAFDRRRHPRVIGKARAIFPRLPLSKLVRDAPARDMQQPALERTARRIVLQFTHLLGHRDNRFLHHLLRFHLGQAGLSRRRKDQLPVGIEELLPMLPVLPVLQPVNQAAPRRH